MPNLELTAQPSPDKHSRCLLFRGSALKTEPGDPDSIEVTISYITGPNDGAMAQKGVTLDRIVIPAILSRFSANPTTPSPTRFERLVVRMLWAIISDLSKRASDVLRKDVEDFIEQ